MLNIICFVFCFFCSRAVRSAPTARAILSRGITTRAEWNTAIVVPVYDSTTHEGYSASSVLPKASLHRTPIQLLQGGYPSLATQAASKPQDATALRSLTTGQQIFC